MAERPEDEDVRCHYCQHLGHRMVDCPHAPEDTPSRADLELHAARIVAHLSRAYGARAGLSEDECGFPVVVWEGEDDWTMSEVIRRIVDGSGCFVEPVNHYTLGVYPL